MRGLRGLGRLGGFLRRTGQVRRVGLVGLVG